MSETPIYDEMKKFQQDIRATAKIEARVELVKQLKAIKKPVKQVQDLIKEYEASGVN